MSTKDKEIKDAVKNTGKTKEVLPITQATVVQITDADLKAVKATLKVEAHPLGGKRQSQSVYPGTDDSNGFSFRSVKKASFSFEYIIANPLLCIKKNVNLAVYTTAAGNKDLIKAIKAKSRKELITLQNAAQ